MDVTLKFQVAETSSRPPRTPTPQPAKPAVTGKVVEPVKNNLDDFKNDPLIKKALEIFKGTIVEVRK